MHLLRKRLKQLAVDLTSLGVELEQLGSEPDRMLRRLNRLPQELHAKRLEEALKKSLIQHADLPRVVGMRSSLDEFLKALN